MTSHSVPDLATPRRNEPSLPNRTNPGLAEPERAGKGRACRTLTIRTATRLDCQAEPGLTAPSPTRPCSTAPQRALPATPELAPPRPAIPDRPNLACHAIPSRPDLATQGLATPRRTLPAVPNRAKHTLLRRTAPCAAMPLQKVIRRPQPLCPWRPDRCRSRPCAPVATLRPRHPCPRHR